MNGKFRTTFDDGTTVENEAPNSTEAKFMAKTERYNKIDPSRTRFAVAADRERHPSIKVAFVEEITDAEKSGAAATRPRAVANPTPGNQAPETNNPAT